MAKFDPKYPCLVRFFFWKFFSAGNHFGVENFSLNIININIFSAQCVRVPDMGMSVVLWVEEREMLLGEKQRLCC